MATNKDTTISLRDRRTHVAVWRAAAAHEDIRLSEFLRRAADDYARRVLVGPSDRAASSVFADGRL